MPKRGRKISTMPGPNRDEQVMESFLTLIGVVPRVQLNRVANELYERGRSESDPSVLITTLLMHHDPDWRVSAEVGSSDPD
jgi:hypothetical protein